MQELARRSGVPTAQSMVPCSKEDVQRFLETATFPVIVKATDAERLRARAGGTKFVIRSGRELLDLYAKAADREKPSLLIQEFIPGEDWMFDGYFDENSRCVFGVTGKKIRRFPVNTGVTSLGICIRNETVERTTVEFMKAIGYQGILDIGYRYDQRDGKYKVLDVNPRIGCTFRLFHRNQWHGCRPRALSASHRATGSRRAGSRGTQMDGRGLRPVLSPSVFARRQLNIAGLDEVFSRRSRDGLLCDRRSAPLPTDANSGLLRALSMDSRPQWHPKARSSEITPTQLPRLTPILHCR